MKHESTIKKINQELISAFASLDAWFDKTLDDGFDHDEQWGTLDILQHVITSNHYLLEMLSEGYDFALGGFAKQGRSEAEESFYAMRYALREQLFHCLCLLDELHTAADDESKEMNLYDKLSSLTNHLQYHLECFEESAVHGR